MHILRISWRPHDNDDDYGFDDDDGDGDDYDAVAPTSNTRGHTLQMVIFQMS